VTVTVKQPNEKPPPQPQPPPPPPGDAKPLLDDEQPGQVRPWPGSPAPSPPPPPEANLPIGQDPVSYLKRLIEYYVTHERGFVAVAEGCEEKLDVELYPLRQGWTAFARYSGTSREERVDYLYADELSQFAERAVLALLYDKPISTTILRDTVLRADSKRAVQRIHGTNHFVLALGTQIRGGKVPSALDDPTAPTADQIRIFTPITLSLGYRGKFENWGIETLFELAVGTQKTGTRENIQGGAVDYGGSMSFAIHFLRYLNPRGLSSWFLGAGGRFEAIWFYQITQGGDNGERATLFSGGFDVDLITGVEFMRASKVHFYLEGVVMVPAYLVQNGDGPQKISTWLPGVGLTLGMLF
jgi:hypothetical protein